MSEVRIPTQKRSIEKRNKIIQKGFELMCENGYYNTTTTDIAEYTGVSTGIIYQYFNDKKDIFLAGAQNYSENIMYPMLNIMENQKIDVDHLEELIKSILHKFIDTHTISKKAHEEILAMTHLDEDIANIFKKSELHMTDNIVHLLENNHFKIEHSKEKVHIIVGVVENLCHEIVYHKHDELNYDVMTKEVIDIILNILK